MTGMESTEIFGMNRMIVPVPRTGWRWWEQGIDQSAAMVRRLTIQLLLKIGRFVSLCRLDNPLVVDPLASFGKKTMPLCLAVGRHEQQSR